MNKTFCFLFVNCVLFQLASTAVVAEEILAYCGKQPITTREVDLQLGKNHAWDASSRPADQVVATVVDLIARQRRALATMRKQGIAANAEEIVTYAVQNLQPPENRLEDPDKAIAAIASAREIGELQLLESLAFRLSWKRYLEKYVTEANIKRHFSNQKSRFDGTKYSIHLIIARPAWSGGSQEAVSKLASLRKLKADEILAAAEEAAEGLSQQQVDLSGVSSLPPAIFSAVDKVADGEWTEVIETPVIHVLAQRIKTSPGDKKLSEVTDAVRAHMLLHLLDHLAKQSEKKLPLRWADL